MHASSLRSELLNAPTPTTGIADSRGRESEKSATRTRGTRPRRKHRKLRLEPWEGALLEWAAAWDPAYRARVQEAIDCSPAHLANVIDGRRGIDPLHHAILREAVSPDAKLLRTRFSTGFFRQGVDELRRLRRDSDADLSSSVLRRGLDRLKFRGAVDGKLLRTLRRRLREHARSGGPLRVGTRDLRVQHVSKGDRCEIGSYFHSFSLRDADGSTVVWLGTGLRESAKYTNWQRFCIDVSGQGCIRGFAEPVLRELVHGLIDPESTTVDVDFAIDVAAHPGRVLVLDRPVRGLHRRVRVHWHLGRPGSALGGGIELGGRSSKGTSVSVYDLVARVQASKECARGTRGALTPLAERLSLPWNEGDVTRIELRVRGCTGVVNLAAEVERAASRLMVVDLAAVAPESPADEIITVKAREYGVTRTIPSAQGIRELLRKHTPNEGDDPRLAYEGLGAAVQRIFLGSGLRPKRAHRLARAINDRALYLLHSAGRKNAIRLDVQVEDMNRIASELASYVRV